MENINEAIEKLSTAELIRLHFFVRDRFETLKQQTPKKWSSTVWNALNEDSVRLNNRIQQQKFREREKQKLILQNQV